MGVKAQFPPAERVALVGSGRKKGTAVCLSMHSPSLYLSVSVYVLVLSWQNECGRAPSTRTEVARNNVLLSHSRRSIHPAPAVCQERRARTGYLFCILKQTQEAQKTHSRPGWECAVLIKNIDCT